MMETKKVDLVKMMLENKMDIDDEEIKEAISGYGFILPGDRVKVRLSDIEKKGIEYIEGTLLSTVPVYMIQTDKGEKHSLNYNYVMDVILVEKNEKKNFEMAIELREQMRKLMVLNAVLTGGAVPKSVQKPQGPSYQ